MPPLLDFIIVFYPFYAGVMIAVYGVFIGAGVLAIRKLYRNKRDREGWWLVVVSTLPITLPLLRDVAPPIWRDLQLAMISRVEVDPSVRRTLVLHELSGQPPSALAHYLAETGLFEVFVQNRGPFFSPVTPQSWKLVVSEGGDCHQRRRELTEFVQRSNYRICASPVVASIPAEALHLYLDRWLAPNARKGVNADYYWVFELSQRRGDRESVVIYEESLSFPRSQDSWFIDVASILPRRSQPSPRPDPAARLFAALEIDPKLIAAPGR